MIQFSENEIKAITAIVQNRTGEILVNALKSRKDMLVVGWLQNLDPNYGAHMRGKISELSELISTFETLMKRKE